MPGSAVNQFGKRWNEWAAARGREGRRPLGLAEWSIRSRYAKSGDAGSPTERAPPLDDHRCARARARALPASAFLAFERSCGSTEERLRRKRERDCCWLLADRDALAFRDIVKSWTHPHPSIRQTRRNAPALQRLIQRHGQSQIMESRLTTHSARAIEDLTEKRTFGLATSPSHCGQRIAITDPSEGRSMVIGRTGRANRSGRVDERRNDLAERERGDTPDIVMAVCPA